MKNKKKGAGLDLQGVSGRVEEFRKKMSEQLSYRVLEDRMEVHEQLLRRS